MLSVLPGARAARSAEPILIGEIDSRTGILTAQGLAISEGVRIAVDAANAAGGVRGRLLRLLQRDDEGKAERAIAAAEGLVARHGVVGLTGGYVDSLVGPVSEVAERTRGLATRAPGQHVRTLLRVARRGCMLDAGRILVAGTGPALLDTPEVRRTLLDLGQETSP